jgi:hypothetical protein
MKYTPDPIPVIGVNQIFCFGSNEGGIHGAGAAKLAYEELGAKLGQGFGLAGRSYAIPTKSRKLETLPLKRIGDYIAIFYYDAESYPQYEFLVTKIGCGLAGYKPEEIAPLFITEMPQVPSNVVLPEEFVNVINSIKNGYYTKEESLPTEAGQ